MKLFDKKIITFVLLLFVAGLTLVAIIFKNQESAIGPAGQSNLSPTRDTREAAVEKADLIGPGGNLPADAPSKKEFKNFAIPVPGVLSRSGKSSIENFQWLKDHGWKSVVDLREEKEGLDTSISGFNELGLNFLNISIPNGKAPTVKQADDFLKFVTDPSNQPVHIHCRAGVGRTGVLTVLYRYSVQGWTMDKSIAEMVLFRKDGPNASQQKFFNDWEKEHTPGDYVK
jgi:protein tyrosine/serine phosphatase